MIAALDPFHTIGLDMDGTLIDHPRSHLLRQYVRQHCGKKAFYIVTFRTGAYAAETLPELKDHYVPETCWAGLLSIPHELWAAHAADEKRRRSGKLTGPQTEAELNYKLWKGYACSRVGAQVLVDDRADAVIPGCEKYGVHFIDIDAL
jgi:hypothetical protein